MKNQILEIREMKNGIKIIMLVPLESFKLKDIAFGNKSIETSLKDNKAKPIEYIKDSDQPKAAMYLEALAYRAKPPVKELDIEQGNELLYKYEGVSGVKASYESWNGLMPVAKKAYEELNTLATPKSQFKASDLREGIRKALATFDVHELWLMTVICVEFINDLKQVSVDHIIQVSPDGLS